MIRSSRCSPRGSDYAILPIILKRRIYDTRLLSLFCGFISIFIFLSWAASSVRLSLRCFSVFCLTAILCFHGASIYIYLYSISICSYYTRDFPRLFFSLVFSSLVMYYFMCYMIFIYLYACEGSLCLGGTSQIYRKWSPGVGPAVRRSALEPSASPHR